MIGYYVHHVGRGHLHRAEALACRLVGRGEEVTGLSSLPRPDGWPGAWVDLARDDDGTPVDGSAGGRLHWAPLGHEGLRRRTATVSAWIAAAEPEAMVVDVSVEMVLLARLHGVPVVSVVQPGVRDDAAHTLGYDVADALVAFWPAAATAMAEGLPRSARERLVPVGALSRHPARRPRGVGRPGRATRTVVLLLGRGGHDVSEDDVASARSETPGWEWVVLDGRESTWVDDPSTVLASADVVVTHAGQNALSDTAAARRPAVVLPQRRPHREQATTAAALASGWPVVVRDHWPAEGWGELLDEAAGLDGTRWEQWCDGGAADRFADVVLEVRERVHPGVPA